MGDPTGDALRMKRFIGSDGTGEFYGPELTRPPVSMDEVERLRAALEQIVQGVPRPVGKSWFPDGRPSKHDRCTHGVWMYEPCDNCLDAFIHSVLTKEDYP